MRILKIVMLSMFFYSQLISAAWFAEPELPLQLSDFPNAERNEQQLTISYTGLSALPALPPGQALKVKIMIPPGLLRVVFSGSSNLFQAAPGKLVLYNAFPTNPSNFCLTSTPNCVSPSDLKGTAAGLGASIYNSETPSVNVQYGYLVIYNPPEARQSFSFSSVQISLVTGDYNSYMNWLGGGEPPSATSQLTLINNSNMGNVSISGNINPASCVESSCIYTVTTNTYLTLTANPNSNYRFVQWSGSECQGQINGNIIGIQMDRHKTCIAEYQIISAPDNSEDTNAKLSNISTRAIVDVGDNNAIAGFVIEGEGTLKVLIKAAGQSLRDAGLDTSLNPKLILIDMQTGETIAENDDWVSNLRQGEVPSIMLPTHPQDAMLVMDLAVGAYTALVSPIDSSGVGLVSVDVLK